MQYATKLVPIAIAALVAAAACAQGETAGVDPGRAGAFPVGTGGSGGSASSTRSARGASGSTTTTPSASSTTGSSGGPPTNCTQANDYTGCCIGSTAYFCTMAGVLTEKPCTSGKVCGWSTKYNDYECVSPPGGPDPSGQNPIDCQ